MPRSRGIGALVGIAALVVGRGASAEIDFKYGGLISSDIRYRFGGESFNSRYPSQFQLLPNGFSRNENLIKTQISASVAGRVKAVGDVDLYLYGFSDTNNIDALTLRERVDPYRLEVNAAYIDVYKLLPGLDLRVGRQVVVWGAADKFSPTNNVNTLDLSDPLLFGKALANNMIRADYNPFGDWILTGVFIPIFRPAELPRTAPAALLDVDRPAPVQEELIRNRLHDDVGIMRPKELNLVAFQPEPSIQNVQYAFRASGRVLDQDISVSYYNGRFGIPTLSTTLFHPNSNVDVGVVWPRMQVLGADIAGSIPWLHGMGYWIEGAVYFPQAVDFSLYQDVETRDANQKLSTIHYEQRFTIKDGKFAVREPNEIDANGKFKGPLVGTRGTVVSSTPFFKLTVGGDISLGSHVYLNAQYVHGFIDEFGSGVVARPLRDPADPLEKARVEQRLGDYFVAGCDVKLASDTLLLRFFGVIKVPSIDWSTKSFDPYVPTAVLFPQISYAVWDATELSVGAFIYLGDRTTKFGDPAAGASEVFAKAKFTY